MQFSQQTPPNERVAGQMPATNIQPTVSGLSFQGSVFFNVGKCHCSGCHPRVKHSDSFFRGDAAHWNRISYHSSELRRVSHPFFASLRKATTVYERERPFHRCILRRTMSGRGTMCRFAKETEPNSLRNEDKHRESRPITSRKNETDRRALRQCDFEILRIPIQIVLSTLTQIDPFRLSRPTVTRKSVPCSMPNVTCP